MGPMYEEEIDGFEDIDFSGPPTKLFPLSQYKFTDPCQECLVQPMCTMRCERKHLNEDWIAYKINFKHTMKDLFFGEPIITGFIAGAAILVGVGILKVGFMIITATLK